MEKYTNLQELGQGAFGKVYKAEREEDGSTHALKCLTVDSIDKGQVVLKEIHALQQVGEHPNIMQFTDAFTEGGGLNTPAMNVWLVLEYCNGGTLDSFILGSKPDRTSVLQLLCDTTEGVAYLHGRNIVHRDLKPDNILVDNSGQRPIVKIADFGIARVCEQSGWDINSYCMQTAVGTRLYLSPEIIGPLLAQRPDQVTYTAKTDVFALGLIIAALLDRTTVPFNPGKVTPFHPDPVNGQPTAVAEVMVTHPEYPAADMLLMSEPPGSPVKALVLAMLAADPHQRPTSEQVLGTLRQITNSPHTAAILASPVMPPPPPYTVVEVPVESSEPETWQDRLSSCCAACWRCDDGEEWYHLAGKGPGWVIVLLILWLVVIMAVIIAVFCVVAYMCFCCVLACLSHEEEERVVVVERRTNLLGALVAVGTLGAFSD